MHFQRLVVSVLLAVGSTALASDPMGVVALPSAVSMEPDVATATKVKISGLFTRWNPTTTQYGAVESGYTYYACPAGKEAQCRTEWSEIKTAATNSACIGYGGFALATGVVRPTTQPATSPDAWPIQMGTSAAIYSPCQSLKGAAINVGAGGPYTIGEGGKVGLVGTCSAGAGSATWDLNSDGVYGDAPGLTPTFDATTIDGPAQRTVAIKCGAVIASANVTIDNVGPAVLSTPVLSAREGQPYRYPVKFRDPANDAVTVRLATGPVGMVLDQDYALVWDKPSVGTSEVTVVLRDKDNAETTHAFTLTVLGQEAPVAKKGCSAGLGGPLALVALLVVGKLRRRRQAVCS